MASSISLVDSLGNPAGSRCDFPVVSQGYTYLPGMQFVITRDIADAATADYDTPAPCALRVIDVWAEKRAANGGAANTVQVLKAAAPISSVLSLNVNTGVVARTTALGGGLDGETSFAKDAVIKTTVTKAGGNAAVRVHISCVAV